MQEEIENRSVTLVITTSKLTARVLRDGLATVKCTEKIR